MCIWTKPGLYGKKYFICASELSLLCKEYNLMLFVHLSYARSVWESTLIVHLNQTYFVEKCFICASELRRLCREIHFICESEQSLLCKRIHFSICPFFSVKPHPIVLVFPIDLICLSLSCRPKVPAQSSHSKTSQKNSLHQYHSSIIHWLNQSSSVAFCFKPTIVRLGS